MKNLTLTRFCRLGLLLAGALPIILCLGATTEADMPIYTDRLVSGWEDWGWATHSTSNTAPAHSGVHSISITCKESWEGLYLHHAEMDTRSYTNLSLWVHGGTEGGQLLRIGAKRGTNDVPGYALPPLEPNKWQQIVVPLSLLEVENKTDFTGFLIQVMGDSPMGTFYVDDIRLGVFVPPPPPAPQSAQPAAPETKDQPPGSAGFDKSTLKIAGIIAGGVALIALLMLWLIVVIKRGPLGGSKVVTVAPAALPAPGASTEALEEGSAENWRERAQVAEALASKQAQVLREKLMPELTEFAKHTIVQGLAAQRDSLLETQRKAQQEVAELEARLARLQLPLRDRIRAYEERVTELERELTTRGEEMRELVKATLSLVRQRLEEERKAEMGGGRDNGRG